MKLKVIYDSFGKFRFNSNRKSQIYLKIFQESLVDFISKSYLELQSYRHLIKA